MPSHRIDMAENQMGFLEVVQAQQPLIPPSTRQACSRGMVVAKSGTKMQNVSYTHLQGMFEYPGKFVLKRVR